MGENTGEKNRLTAFMVIYLHVLFLQELKRKYEELKKSYYNAVEHSKELEYKLDRAKCVSKLLPNENKSAIDSGKIILQYFKLGNANRAKCQNFIFKRKKMLLTLSEQNQEHLQKIVTITFLLKL